MPMPVLDETKVKSPVVNKIPALNNNNNNNNNNTVNKTPVKTTELLKKEAITPASIGVNNKMNTTGTAVASAATTSNTQPNNQMYFKINL